MNIANQIILMLACMFAGGAIVSGVDKIDQRSPRTWFPTVTLAVLAAVLLVALCARPDFWASVGMLIGGAGALGVARAWRNQSSQ